MYGRMDGQMDTPEFQSIRSLPGNGLKIIVHDWQLRKKVLWIIIISDDHVLFHWLMHSKAKLDNPQSCGAGALYGPNDANVYY